MTDDDILYMTPEGLQQLKDELANLKTVRREEVAYKLEVAIKQGDLKENADYHDAKEEQGFIESRIRQVEDMLSRAKVIEKSGPKGVVQVGSTVTVSEDGYDDMETYTIVGAAEA
ncbi:MAG: transcription elongation factor GreA, partial [Anaerolineae bacterium]|nr:transcription elongation factor GreA [Anaerolineae bacterium]